MQYHISFFFFIFPKFQEDSYGSGVHLAKEKSKREMGLSVKNA
jgi:hypothetical protein